MCLENGTSTFVANLVNVGKKLETKLQYFDIYLHNENILEYALLLVRSGRFMIFHIEGRSNKYVCTYTIIHPMENVYCYMFYYTGRQYLDLHGRQRIGGLGG